MGNALWLIRSLSRSVGLVHLWTDQRIPGHVSCRCPSDSLETPPCWHTTICLYRMLYIVWDVTKLHVIPVLEWMWIYLYYSIMSSFQQINNQIVLYKFNLTVKKLFVFSSGQAYGRERQNGFIRIAWDVTKLHVIHVLEWMWIYLYYSIISSFQQINNQTVLCKFNLTVKKIINKWK